MTDTEILSTLKKTAGNTCGRFAPEQLQRPMVNEVPYSLKPYRFFLSAFIPAFFLVNTLPAQNRLLGKVKMVKEQPAPDVVVKGETKLIMGAPAKIVRPLLGKVTDENGTPLPGASVIIKGSNKGVAAKADGTFELGASIDKAVIIVSHVGFPSMELTISNSKFNTITLNRNNKVLMGMVMGDIKLGNRIKGRVVNEEGEGLPYSTILLNQTKQYSASDSLGNFEMVLPATQTNASISVTHAGYANGVKTIRLNEGDMESLTVTLTKTQALPPVTVVSFANNSCSSIVGGLSIVRRITLFDTVRTFIVKAVKTPLFKVYPNPVKKGSVINLLFKQPGEYNVQVFDNSGRLYLSTVVVSDAKKSTADLVLPPSVASGTFYMKALHLKSKKQFTDKLIVQ